MARPRWSTESGLPQTYLLLRARWDAQGREWVKVRIPVRPNGRTGWVKRDALGAFHLTHLLVVVDRQRLQILLYRSGRLVWSAPVAVGKPSTPTPPGRFWITERFKIENPSSGYWPYAFGTSDYSTLTDWPEGGVVGLHGLLSAPTDPRTDLARMHPPPRSRRCVAGEPRLRRTGARRRRAAACSRPVLSSWCRPRPRRARKQERDDRLFALSLVRFSDEWRRVCACRAPESGRHAMAGAPGAVDRSVSRTGVWLQRALVARSRRRAGVGMFAGRHTCRCSSGQA